MFAVALIFVSLKATDSTPTLIAQKTQNATWIVPIISFLLILPSFLLMIYLLKKYNNKNLVELFEAVTGKWIGKLLGFVIFLFCMSALMFESRNYIDQIKVLYFPNSPLEILFFLFIGVVFFGAKKGIEVIGFTAWISFPIIQFTAFVVIILISGEVILQRVFPIFGSGLGAVQTQGYSKAAIFGELFVLLIAYNATKESHMFRKGVLLAAFVSLFEIVIFYFVYITVFDYNSIQKAAFPFHDINQFISFGNFFTNIETVFMIFWLFAAFLKFIILIYFSAWIFGAIFNLKNFEPFSRSRDIGK